MGRFIHIIYALAALKVDLKAEKVDASFISESFRVSAGMVSYRGMDP